MGHGVDIAHLTSLPTYFDSGIEHIWSIYNACMDSSSL